MGINVCTCSRFGHGQEANDDIAIIFIGTDLFFISLIYMLVTKVCMSVEPKEKLDARYPIRFVTGSVEEIHSIVLNAYYLIS